MPRPRRFSLPPQRRSACALLVSWSWPLCVLAMPADPSGHPPRLMQTLWTQRVLAERWEDKPVCLLLLWPRDH